MVSPAYVLSSKCFCSMRCLSLLLTLLCSITLVTARPAYPGVLYATLTDGTRVAYRLHGDEHSHVCLTLDGRYIERIEAPVIAEDNGAVATSQPVLWRYAEAPAHQQLPSAARQPQAVADNRYTDFPTIGQVRGLVILADFTDRHFAPEHTRELLHRQLNEPGYSDNGATGSARDYFMAQSMGKFQPQFDVVGPVQLPHDMAYYGQNWLNGDARPAQMIEDACQQAHDAHGIDFGQYDYDGNGDVDFVFVIYAGYGENYGAPDYTVWPHMGRLSTSWIDLRLDGRRVNLYACSCELRGSDGARLDGIGALCHEFGHVLGLPDLYNPFAQDQIQLGQWDVMDVGSYNNESRTPPSYTAFERHQCGWLHFVDLTQPAAPVIVPELTQSNVAYRIATATPYEFFTLENHQRIGWDSAQGGTGLMIIHVKYDAQVWQNNTVNAGATPHYDLVEADGTPGLTYETDLFPIAGHDAFADYSTPNSLAWNGEPTCRSVTHITQHDDGTISFSFMNDRLPSPEVLPVRSLTDTSFVAEWMPVEGAVGYRMHITEVVPESLNPLLLAEDFALFAEGGYPNAASQNVADELDDFMHQPGWTGSHVYPCGGMVRIGQSSVAGQITTPLFSCADEGLTVAISGRAYMGKTIDYDIKLLDADFNELQTITLQADRNLQTPFVRFENCPSDCRLRIATRNERLFIDELRIGRADIDSLTLWSAEEREWELETTVEDALPASDVVSMAVGGLHPGFTYSYYVTALHSEPMRHSLPSAEQTVTLPTVDPSGIHDIHVSGVSSSRCYDLQGRTHSSAPVRPGLYVVGGSKVLIRK